MSTILCDTTLRDGEQAVGVAFSPEDKLLIARLLDQAGVGEIEAGMPATSPAEIALIRSITQLGLKAAISGWCRVVKSDVDAALNAGLTRVALAVPVSEIHLSRKLKKSRQWAEGELKACLEYAKAKGLFATAAFEDASRADFDDLLSFVDVAVAAKADRIRVSDTVGVLDPVKTRELVEVVRTRTILPLEFHGHNDYGLATANALAASQAGASHLSVTVLGLGERAGNAALEEVALALKHLKGVDAGIDSTKLPALFREVSRASGRPIPAGKPHAGSAVFSHGSGIHQDGVLKHPKVYEPYPPKLVGQCHKIVIGKLSGKAAVKKKLADLGIRIAPSRLVGLMEEIRSAAQRLGGQLSDSDLAGLCCGLKKRGDGEPENL